MGKSIVFFLGFCLYGMIGFAQTAPITATISFSWAGLTPTWLGYDYKIVCNHARCFLSGQRWEIRMTPQRQQEAVCRHNNRAIEARGLLEALQKAAQNNLEAVDKPIRVIEHTDDYPRFKITLRQGGQTLVLLNTSNSQNPPWNVQQGGQWFVQRSGEIEVAFTELMKNVPCQQK